MTPFEILLYFAILPAVFVAVGMPLGYVILRKLRKKSPKFKAATDVFNLWLDKKSPDIKGAITTLCVIAFFAYVIFR
jgi:hypothetical protein